MKNFLFRGKRIDNGKWIYGDLQSQAIPFTSILTYEQESGYGSLIPVDPTTVGQYTGKKDKNGNKIFDGDIAETEGKNVDYAIFAEGCFCWTKAMMCSEFTYGTDGYRIIGNIYDNPELMR